ncbi:MAG: IclR family transcriptional regulator [Burkholderiales bacterium]
MNGILERTLGILEHLATHADGLPLASIADGLSIPRSAAHRLLTDLCRCGYVRQVRDHGDYVLTIKLVSLGLGFLSNSGIVDIAQPLLDRLAETSHELVRLSIIDGDRLTWVARAQGARSGLRYDPDMGMDARLSCTATGHAWLLTMPDERALELVARQGFGSPEDYGPRAPKTVSALLKMIHAARERGFSLIDEVFTPGMTAMAAPVIKRGQDAIGVISIAGPRVRLTVERMLELGPHLLAAAAELAASSSASAHFKKQPFQGRA